jgi:ribosomal protein S18 acetylase RimI-like enzyme
MSAPRAAAGLRPAVAADAAFLAEMLAAAAFWRPDGPAGSVDDVLNEPALAHYVAGWPRPGDRGVIAEEGRPVGAAWLRLFPADDPGFGFVDAGTPELSIGVVRERRGRGVGSLLLGALIARARRDGLGAVSLSVEPDNPARRLYRRFGFEAVGGPGGAVTMLLRL